MKNRIHKRLTTGYVEMILDAFNERRLTERQACRLLEINRSRFYELRKQWLVASIRNLPFVLWNRGKSDFHKLPDEVQKWLHNELRYIRSEAEVFRGVFNFALLTEELQKEFGETFHRNTIRRFALRHGYYHALPEEKAKVYARFEMTAPGMLYQHDSSHHHWIPLIEGKQSLILSKDDHSRVIVGGNLTLAETAYEHLKTVKETIEVYGCPLAYYVDNHSIFRYVGYTGRHFHYHKKPDEGEQQFKRALSELGIGLIYTGKGEAQAKGKIEKAFDYFQRRIPYLCEKYKVSNIQEANKILRDSIAFYNEQRVHEETGEIPIKRWQAAEQEGRVRARSLKPEDNLDMMFSLQEERTVKKDGTISFLGQLWRVGKYVGEKVTVCYVPDEKITIVKDKHQICQYRL